MAEGAHDDATLAAYGRAQERFELHGGYHWRDRALATARGLGFDDGEIDRRLSTFSGGELTRASKSRGRRVASGAGGDRRPELSLAGFRQPELLLEGRGPVARSYA